MTRLRPAALVAALVTLSALFWVVPAASAVPVPDSAVAARVPCVRPTTTRTTPKWHKLDEGQASPADVAALPARKTTRSFVSREVEPLLTGSVVIPVYVHVIKGRKRGERNPISRQGVRRLIGILNNGMAGGQNPAGKATRYRFSLKHVDFHRNEGWYHAYFFGPRDIRMKRRLHRGGARTLNLYINRGGPRGQPVLGWSRFPWQYASTPKLDGVSVNVAGLHPGRPRDPRDRPLARPPAHLPGRLRGQRRPGLRHSRGGRAELLLPDHPRHLHLARPGPRAQLHGLLLRQLHEHVHRRPGTTDGCGVRQVAVARIT